MLAWLPFILITLLTLFISTRLWQLPATKYRHLKRLALLLVIWILTAICLTPTTYDFSSSVVLPYITLGPAKIIPNPIRQLDLGFWLNILLTVPLGFMLGWNWPTFSWQKIILLGLLTGLSLETGQFILDWLVHLNRWVDIDDVLTNWAGVILGFGSYQLIAHLPGCHWLQK